MAKAATTLKTASVLAFERKLANSDALMLAGNWQQENWQPVVIQEKSVRGTISNRLKNAISSDPAKLDAEIQKPNLQTVDVASLPFDADTLKVVFTLRVLGNLALPSVCNSQDYQQALTDLINGYAREQGFGVLAARYAENIASGRFLWRNRIGAEAVQVVVTHDDKRWEFNGEDYSLRQFSQPAGALAELAGVIEQALAGSDAAFLRVEAQVKLGNGQEVFPSQELVLDERARNGKSKILYQVNDVAAIHSQKIGNALRTVDDWHPQAAETGPIAVEPYGSVTSRGRAYRQPKDKMDFYTLLDNWVRKGDVPAVAQQHYVIATLIRGGVFGEKGE
ncbi:CRISPR-associated protein Csy3 [Dickeya dianthicola]|uniref:Type I-F CRISPR-associated protein Csy3 n=1 Tax=Dickeya dianthicola TaxID=204039 RepID=A0AAP2D443_9GAMM|nr:type I-F CRISPR-associated protein Csy3 [Dickeya dianthicola]ATO34627.1 CRISPR-associated protein, Csy3 family [Dickeya dianthicola RNS04.9]AYC20489.1 CRISPR-associated protein Csy3 [Dickeya dianthicola]MBI0440106.1 type I-F CRISPR-associated protein Csy3 [Dickeya dianthicola]MBI0451030.1 type I-F CRISPR-associated protein Csy3 [Dickeya dianthicola]MBI0455495.1 type I-F CRISPR-associated protein Csy3 [Dickeya dianthicola]